jgi:plasmid stability protein
MTVTITLPPETEEKLRRRAAEHGQTLEAYLQQLAERHAWSGHDSPTPEPNSERTFDQILAPVRDGFANSGLTDDELTDLFEEAREEVWQEKQQRQKGPE